MSEQELILDASELRCIIFECNNCRTRVTLRVGTTPSHLKEPFRCPGCDWELSSVSKMLEAYRNFVFFLEQVAPPAVTVRFCLSNPEKSGES